MGTYGIAVLDADHPDRIVVARNGSPVLLGIGEREMFVASDVAALVGYTRQVVYLDDGELASITADGYRTFTLDDRSTAKSPSTIDWDVAGAEIGDHAHFLPRRSPSSRRRSSGRCAGASTSGSPPRTSAGSTCRCARPASSAG